MKHDMQITTAKQWANIHNIWIIRFLPLAPRTGFDGLIFYVHSEMSNSSHEETLLEEDST